MTKGFASQDYSWVLNTKINTEEHRRETTQNFTEKNKKIVYLASQVYTAKITGYVVLTV